MAPLGSRTYLDYITVSIIVGSRVFSLKEPLRRDVKRETYAAAGID